VVVVRPPVIVQPPVVVLPEPPVEDPQPIFPTYNIYSMLYGEENWVTMLPDNWIGLQHADSSLNNGWKFVDIDGTYYKIVGNDERCLDVNPADKKVFATNCGNYSGQMWKLEYLEDLRVYKLKTAYTGEGMCLNVTMEGFNYLQMTPCDANDSQSFQLLQEAQQ
jgi:hypothetical protein